MRSSRIPSCLNLSTSLFRLSSLYIFSQPRHFLRILIAPHESHTGDQARIASNKAVKQFPIQGLTDILPEMLTMASRAVTRTTGEVERKRHLSGNLLKDYVV